MKKTLMKMQKKYKRFCIYEKFRLDIALFICAFVILYLAIRIGKILVLPIVDHLVIFPYSIYMLVFVFNGEYKLVKKENDFFICEAIDEKGSFHTNFREMEIQKLMDMTVQEQTSII